MARQIGCEVACNVGPGGVPIETGDGAMSKRKFKVGDRVRFLGSPYPGGLEVGRVYVVRSVPTTWTIGFVDGDGCDRERGSSEFVHADTPAPTATLSLTIERAGTEDAVYRVTDAGGHEVLHVRADEWDNVKATVERVR